MTTTAYDDVTTATQSGSRNSWVNVSTLASSTSGAAYVECSGTFAEIKTLELKIPDYMSSLTPGSEFVSMSVQFKAYVSTAYSGDYFRFRAYQNGGMTYNLSVDSTSTSTYTVSGDSAFWGFSGSVQQIIKDLASGAILWRFEGEAPLSVYQRRDVKNFQVQLTYRDPDTKRAALLQVIP